MLADHVCYLFFPKLIILRIAGRLAFPIFAFLAVEGYRHTKNIKKYLFRIFIFFVISQPIYQYTFNPRIEKLNIFADLFFGLLALYLYDHIANKKDALAVVFMVAIFCNYIGLGFGFFGILLIFSFYLFDIKKDFYKLFFIQLILLVLFIGQMKFAYSSINIALPIIWFAIQFGYLIPLCLLKYYNGQRGYYSKYIFYTFYPLHIFVLGLIAHSI